LKSFKPSFQHTSGNLTAVISTIYSGVSNLSSTDRNAFLAAQQVVTNNIGEISLFDPLLNPVKRNLKQYVSSPEVTNNYKMFVSNSRNLQQTIERVFYSQIIVSGFVGNSAALEDTLRRNFNDTNNYTKLIKQNSPKLSNLTIFSVVISNNAIGSPTVSPVALPTTLPTESPVFPVNANRASSAGVVNVFKDKITISAIVMFFVLVVCAVLYFYNKTHDAIEKDNDDDGVNETINKIDENDTSRDVEYDVSTTKMLSSFQYPQNFNSQNSNKAPPHFTVMGGIFPSSNVKLNDNINQVFDNSIENELYLDVVSGSMYKDPEVESVYFPPSVSGDGDSLPSRSHSASHSSSFSDIFNYKIDSDSPDYSTKKKNTNKKGAKKEKSDFVVEKVRGGIEEGSPGYSLSIGSHSHSASSSAEEDEDDFDNNQISSEDQANNESNGRRKNIPKIPTGFDNSLEKLHKIRVNNNARKAPSSTTSSASGENNAFESTSGGSSIQNPMRRTQSALPYKAMSDRVAEFGNNRQQRNVQDAQKKEILVHMGVPFTAKTQTNNGSSSGEESNKKKTIKASLTSFYGAQFLNSSNTSVSTPHVAQNDDLSTENVYKSGTDNEFEFDLGRQQPTTHQHHQVKKNTGRHEVR